MPALKSYLLAHAAAVAVKALGPRLSNALLIATVTAIPTALLTSYATVERMAEKVAALNQRIEAHERRLNEHDSRLIADEVRSASEIAERGERIKGIEAQQAAHDREIAELRRRVRY